jgi:hypothetical protein
MQMQRHYFTSLWFFVMLLVLCIVSTVKLQADDVPPAQLLDTLLSPNTSDDQWQRAEASFLKLPGEAAIRTLYHEVAKGIPGGMAYPKYNCSDPEHDRRIAYWGRYCVANWLWCKELSCSGWNSLVSKTLLDLWIQPQSTYGRSVLLTALDSSSWVPEAEEPVRRLFTDTEAEAKLRQQAAACLLHHFGARYQHEVVVFALSSPREIRDLLFRELVSPPHARVSGIDPAVVRMGFWLMFEEMAGNEDRFAHRRVGGSYYGAFLPANQLGTYLDEQFAPDYKLPKYQGEQGKEIWYTDTVENAFTWWIKNKEHYAN